MRRRGIGIGAVQRTQERNKQYEEVGDRIQKDQMAHINQQLQLFRTNLQEYAIKYKDTIKKDVEFRKRFQIMCSKIGVDPLASNKGFWSELLDFGDFYYELAVQIIEICIFTRIKNGGLIDMDELINLLRQKRGSLMQNIGEDDIRRSVKKLRILGEGFNIVELGSRTMIITVPVVLSSDHSSILTVAQANQGKANEITLAEQLKWDSRRSNICLTILMKEGMAWLDEQDPSGSAMYYFPSLVFQNISE